MGKAYQYWLGNTMNLGNKKIISLVEHFGSAYQVYHADSKELKHVGGMSQEEIDILMNHKKIWDIEKEYEKIKSSDVKFITIEDEIYPNKLKRICNYPYNLYIKGELPDDKLPSVAIVGSRMCSEYGKKTAIEFGHKLAESGVQIVSGLAKGIDGISHKSAIEVSGKTFAVLGNGIDICYPKENRDIYENIPCGHGGILSQFPFGTSPKSNHFPIRNEIISGLSDIVLVIEAREKSGSLITADMALEQGRDVFAVPGRICDTLSEGCNRLIKQGAGIALAPEDILSEFGIFSILDIKEQKKTNNSLESTEKVLYSCLDFYPKGLDAIISELSLPIEEIIHTLIGLEIKGYIKEVSKNYYVKNSS